ncbi:MAG: prolyl oligopeptidase family serine peptidase [Saprospiraceae bacterium]|nr:prolyl oligopeptidase family serine peptidase [Saprospiraceae bacterium]
MGFVVVAIDGSCNPGRSKAFHDACYGDMSSNTLPDQVSGMKQLAEKSILILIWIEWVFGAIQRWICMAKLVF